MTTSKYGNYEEPEVSAAIRTQFHVKENLALLPPRWRKKRENSSVPATGFCYLASHAYFQLMGGGNSGLTIKYWKNKNLSWAGHFWVETKHGEPIDLTAEQYKKEYPDGFPYREGVPWKIQLFPPWKKKLILDGERFTAKVHRVLDHK